MAVTNNSPQMGVVKTKYVAAGGAMDDTVATVSTIDTDMHYIHKVGGALEDAANTVLYDMYQENGTKVAFIDMSAGGYSDATYGLDKMHPGLLVTAKRNNSFMLHKSIGVAEDGVGDLYACLTGGNLYSIQSDTVYDQVVNLLEFRIPYALAVLKESSGASSSIAVALASAYTTELGNFS